MRSNEFNAAQYEAITHYKGPAMVLAGPGSGKTRVIVERLRYLIEEMKVPPSSILVITFTKAAAIEMQYRFVKITDSSYPEVSFGTFHSVFYQIIKRSIPQKDSNLEIATESFKYQIIRDILALLKEKRVLGSEDYENSMEEIPEIISEISRIKNMGIDPKDCKKTLLVNNCFDAVFEGYNRALLEFSKIDFDDMIERCYQLLISNESVLKSWQERFEYILIDEYQDINPMQQRVVELLCREHDNLFVVGDDDQSIYGFRGSDPSIMQKFEGRHIHLNINYRCGKDILENALKVIDENKVRFKKDLKAGALDASGKVYARRYESRERQNEAIAVFLENKRDKLSDIAILFRTNSEAMGLARVLNDHDIPSNLQDNTGNIFNDPAVMLCINYLLYVYRENSRALFYKIMNKPMRYISRESVTDEVVNEKKILGYYKGNRERQNQVKTLFNSLRMLKHLRPSLAMRFLRKSIGIDELYPESKDMLDEFERSAVKISDMKLFLSEIDKELERMKNSEGSKKKGKTSGNVVKLMTMHASKGLEFDMVWIPDLNEGIIPQRSAAENMQTEEERRMLYVAMTRAKKALIMSYITGNKENPMLPSRFLKPVKNLWDEAYKDDHSSSSSSSGISTSSSNSASSR